MLDEFDPEIDPSIREEQEQALKDMEFDRRVNAIVEKKIRMWQQQDQRLRAEGQMSDLSASNPDGDIPTDRDDAGLSEREDAENRTPEEARPKRTSKTKKAVRSILSGSVLSSPEMKKLYPYLLATALLLLLLITSTFYIQKLYRQQQRLDNEIKELRTRSIELSAERVQQTSRSSIVKRAKRQGLDI